MNSLTGPYYPIRFDLNKVIPYEKLLPRLFFWKTGDKKYKYRYFFIYRGILIMVKKINERSMHSRSMYSAHHYDFKDGEGRCLQVETTKNEIQSFVDDYLRNYQSQLVYNKNRELKGVVVRKELCGDAECPHINECNEKLRIRNINSLKKYFWVCGNSFKKRHDMELQISDKQTSFFFSPKDRERMKNKRKFSKIYSKESHALIDCPV